MNEFYASHSSMTNPGRYAYLFTDMPHDLAGISRVAQGLVYHYVGDQYRFGYCPPKERIGEIDTRSMERILARLVEMDSHSLTEARSYENRLVGCCRDFSLLACAILRQQGTPARLRYGFANYFVPDYWIDHVIVETWDGKRWQRFDAEVDYNDRFDLLDMPGAPFVTGGRAWQMCHSEGAEPTRFGLGPGVSDVSGEWFIRGRLQLDIAALNKQEMLCWDQWTYASGDFIVSAEDETLLDRAAALSLEADSTALRAMVVDEERLGIPETITCFSPDSGPHPVNLGAF